VPWQRRVTNLQSCTEYAQTDTINGRALEQTITIPDYLMEKAILKEARKAAEADEAAQSAMPPHPPPPQSSTLQLDTLSIMEGFTEALYPDFKVFGREMLANAVDAYRWARFVDAQRMFSSPHF
jgi:hypothetical protein